MRTLKQEGISFRTVGIIFLPFIPTCQEIFESLSLRSSEWVKPETVPFQTEAVDPIHDLTVHGSVILSTRDDYKRW